MKEGRFAGDVQAGRQRDRDAKGQSRKGKARGRRYDCWVEMGVCRECGLTIVMSVCDG